MPKFVKIAPKDEDVLFVAWGKLGRNQDAEKAILVKEGESIEGVVLEMKPSAKYGKILRLKLENQDKPVVITGKSDLNKKLDAGGVAVNDLVRITYTGVVKTQRGNDYYTFELEVAKA